MPVHGVLAQDKPPRDAGVAQSLRDEPETFELTRRQHRHVEDHTRIGHGLAGRAVRPGRPARVGPAVIGQGQAKQAIDGGRFIPVR